MASFSKALLASSCFVLCLLLASCGGSSKPPADFSLSSTPATLIVTPGGAAQQISVNATPINGFNGTVSVAVTGLPSGVTAQPSMLSLTPGTPQNISLSASTAVMGGGATLTLTGTSGSLSHTATVTMTVAPPPDFTLSVSPSAALLTGGGPSVQINVTANPLNSFSSPVSVAISGLPSGVTANPATLTLSPGTPQSIALTADVTVVAGVSSVTFTGTSGSLSHNAAVSLTIQAASKTNAADVTTFQYDVARDGLNSHETTLIPGKVNSTQFGKVAFYTMDGKVDAQPLYLANVVIGGKFHNVIYAATEHGSLYAFDADDNSQLWQVSLLGSGETPSDNHGCSQITPEIGVSATPVIDRSQGPNGTIFAVVTSKDANGGYHHRLHALDLTTGKDTIAPSEVTASYPGTGDNSQGGNVIFDPAQYAERSALLLLNGTIYTGWTSHCDLGVYTGWIMGYSESNLQQTRLLNLTPNGKMGSIWMSGNGMAADSNGFLYVLDANGTFDTTLDMNGFPTKGDFGNAMLKISTANGKLTVVDYFEMYNGPAESSQDVDLGSGGALLLPDQTDSNGVVHHLIVGAGKDTNIYLADRDNLGKFNPATNPADNNIYQELPGANAGRAYSSPAYFNGVLYYSADNDALKAYPMVNAKMATTPSSVSPERFSHPGPTPTISSNGTQNGIVWALTSAEGSPAILHAYDPANLAHELYSSDQAPSGRDAFGNGNKFITPMVANGKVYVGTPTGVAVFGLLSQ